ncbi:MAG: YraN family protein [Pseudomonadota bacterium]
MAEAARRAAERRGRRGETLAAAWLRMKGYKILDQRARTPVGEIDLIAARSGLLVLVEVKARPSLDAALGAVPPGAWRRIQAAADAWIVRRPSYSAWSIRYDIVAIAPGRLPRHVADAWRPD